jgi:hypothetical protein
MKVNAQRWFHLSDSLTVGLFFSWMIGYAKDAVGV